MNKNNGGSEFENPEIDENVTREWFEKNKDKANEYINEPDKLEKLLQKAEKKIEGIPVVGDKLKDIPLLISMMRSFLRKEYTEIPKWTIIAIVLCLMYFVAPIDILPDMIPGFGYIDDAAILLAAHYFISTDLNDYCEWRKQYYRSR